MNLEEFTEKDCETLLEALDAYEHAPISDGMGSSLVTSMLGGGKEEREARIKREMGEAQSKAKTRRSITILLRAKIELTRLAIQQRQIESAS